MKPCACHNRCPKCGSGSGNDWRQCKEECPLDISPHFDVTAASVAARWKTPIPRRLVPTNDRNYPVRAKYGEIHLPLAPHPGAFGVRRQFHTHEGVDLYCPEGTQVHAVEAGIVVAVTPFTGTNAVPPSPWWNDTHAVFVEGPSGVVVYGEIEPLVEVGDRVCALSALGNVKTVLRKDKGYPMTMLHLELHTQGTTQAFDWFEHDKRPPTLLDPTLLLLRASIEEYRIKISLSPPREPSTEIPF